MTDSKQLVLKHVRGPHFTTGLATGVNVMGPTSDGMVHLEFFRDLQVATEEMMSVTEVQGPAGQIGNLMTQAAPATVDYYREVVAVISLPLTTAANLGAGLKVFTDAFGVVSQTPTLAQSQAV